MSSLRNIGNSQGVIIPRALINKAKLQGHTLEFELHPDGLLIKPVKTARAHWQTQIENELKTHGHDLDHEWLDANLMDNDD
jgi:antitoxin component of MazEF toxin-antitoxin module